MSWLIRKLVQGDAMKWEWSKYNREGLASFVTDKAFEFLRLPESRVDLTQSRGRRPLLEVIYNTLVEQKIQYAPEKYYPSAAKQRIRTPAEILNAPGEGTCLDLAILLCGLCLGNDLLPVLIVLEGHALAAVSLNHGLREWDDYREKKELFSHRPLEDSEELKRLIDDEAYLAIECTGFAYSKSLPESVPEGVGRTEEGILPFERAVAAGRGQLDQLERPLRFALDIAVAHYHWEINPLEIPKLDARHSPEIDEVPSPISTASRDAEVILPPPSPPTLSMFEFEVVSVNAQGQEIRRCCEQAEYFIESLGSAVELEMVSLPGGKFQMGSPPPPEEPESGEDERPQHLVNIKPFFMGRYPITQAQWRAIASLPKIKRDLAPDPSCFKGDKRPVERVSWYEVMEFCERLSQKTGREYRLPSEAEWEYACRARTPTQFHFGKTATTNLANYCGEDQKINGILCQGTYSNEPYGVYRKQTTEVGSFPANAFGLYDMHGNVWEWCADYEHEDYQGAPSHGSAWLNDGNSEYRILRGGSWDSSPRFCRSASRFSQDASTLDKEFGFRVVCSFM